MDWLPLSWNAIARALNRAWIEADLPPGELVPFEQTLREELLARKMISPGSAGHTHDQLVRIMRSLFPLGENEWDRARTAIELHLFHHQTHPPA